MIAFLYYDGFDTIVALLLLLLMVLLSSSFDLLVIIQLNHNTLDVLSSRESAFTPTLLSVHFYPCNKVIFWIQILESEWRSFLVLTLCCSTTTIGNSPANQILRQGQPYGRSTCMSLKYYDLLAKKAAALEGRVHIQS